jgi:uncharacterized membrane protein YeaQ/YmgE (transglycosylase-associated protein family)
MLMDYLWTALIGLVVGFIARAVHPAKTILEFS